MIERDGLRYVIPAALVMLVFWVLAFDTAKLFFFIIAFFLTAVTLFVTYFFRDPERIPPGGFANILSPGDGKVIIVEERKTLGRAPFTLVSIFLSVFDVHVNRIPISGTVKHVRHIPGKFHKAFKPEAVAQNERTEITIESKFGEVSFSQVAGILARRIVCRIKPGDQVIRGERMGLIRFGSRIDMFLDPRIQINVKVGDKVVGGESIIGRFPQDG